MDTANPTHAPAVIDPVAQRQRVRRESQREVALNYLFTALFFLAMLACILGGAWLAHRMSGLPQKQPFEMSYVTVQSGRTDFRLAFAEAGLPPAVRALAPAARVLPRVLLDGQEDSMILDAAPHPRLLSLKFFIPERTLPGDYQGELTFTDPTGQEAEHRLPVRLQVLDPFAGFWKALLYYAGAAVLALAVILHLNPQPFGLFYSMVVSTDVQHPDSQLDPVDLRQNYANAHGRVLVGLVLAMLLGLGWLFTHRGVDPSSRAGLGWLCAAFVLGAGLFAWVRPFNRSRRALKEFHEEMPDGEIEFRRRHLLAWGQGGIAVTVRIWDEAAEELRSVESWPRSTRELRSAGAVPLVYSVPERVTMGGAMIFVRPLDHQPDTRHVTKAFCFRFLKSPPVDESCQSQRS